MTTTRPALHQPDGFSLIEAVASIGLVTVGLLGLAAVFVQGARMLASSQADFVVKGKAAEAVESVFAARDMRVLSWDAVRNVAGDTGSDNGVFLDGPHSLREPGPDGLVNTEDDGDLQQLATPGPDNILGTGDDELMPLDGYTREIEIRDEGINLRRIRVIMTYPSGGCDTSVHPDLVDLVLLVADGRRHEGDPSVSMGTAGRPERRPGGIVRRLRQSEAGFTLMELLMATSLTLVVMALTLGSVNDARMASELGTMVLETNQNLRAGMNFMTRDLIQSGDGIPTGGIPIPSGPGTIPVNRPGPDPNLTFPSEPVMHAVTPGARLGPIVNGQQTDVITVLYADRHLRLDEYPLAGIASGGQQATVDSRTDITAVGNGIKVGDLILFSNAVGNAIQTVTSVTTNQTLRFDPGDSFSLNQPTAGQGSIAQLQSGGSFPPTTATRINMVTYYVDAVTNPEHPRLVRHKNFDSARPIAMIVENLQIAYDLSDGSQTLNTDLVNIEEPMSPNTPAQIRKLNLFMAARSAEIDPKTRRLYRTNLATQVSLRNLAFVDRYE